MSKKLGITCGLSIFLLWLQPAGFSLRAQLTVPGRPMGDYRQAKAAAAVYLLPAPDPYRIEAELQSNRDEYGKVFRFALEREVDLSPLNNGTWDREEDYRIWRIHLVSPGAYSLGLVFDQFHLSDGVKLMVYDPDQKHIRGAYSALNNKPSGILAIGQNPGDEIILELQVPLQVDDYGQLALRSVSHAFVDVFNRHAAADCPGDYGCSEPCEIDVNCTEGAGWQNEKRAVVRVSTPTQYCTGVMVNNTSYNGDPLLLTAQHCIDNAFLANATVYEFNYESPGCFAGDGSTDMSVSGSDLLAVGDSIDFSLVRLSVPPPVSFEPYYAGWDLSGNQAGGSTVIHHPEGDVKKISFDLQTPSSTNDPGDIPSGFEEYLYYSFWWIKQWDTGSTEPGSSGSPLLSSGRKVIGLLSFGKARCGDSIGYDAGTDRTIFSKTVNVDDYFTKLNVAWDHYPEPGMSLESWLDPGSTGQNSVDSYEPSSIRRLLTARGGKYRIYPNPADQFVYIAASELPDSNVRIGLFDLNGGQLVEETGIFPGTVALETGNLAPGVYLLRIRDRYGVETLKLVVE